MRDATKAILITVAFLCALIAGDRVISWGLRTAMSYSQNRFVDLYQGRFTPGVLVLGNSRSDRHFPAPQVAEISGVDVANLGLGGESTMLSEALLYDYVDRVGKPQLLIVEASNLSVAPDNMGDMRLFGTYSERIRELTRQWKPKLYYTSALFNLFQLNNEMFFRVMLAIVRKERDRRHFAVIPDVMVERLRTEKARPIDLREANRNALLRILKYTEERDIPTRVIVTPYLDVRNSEVEAFTAEFVSESQQALGRLKVWDYSKALPDREHFRDRVHLNAKGVDALLSKLKTDGFFSFH